MQFADFDKENPGAHDEAVVWQGSVKWKHEPEPNSLRTPIVPFGIVSGFHHKHKPGKCAAVAGSSGGSHR